MASTNLPLDGRFNTSRGEQNIGIPPTQIAPRPTEFGILTLEKVRVISRLRETVRHPTTGFLNYFLSLAFCDHVTVYGFWPFAMTPDHRPLPYHYFDNETFPINHNIIDEQVFLRDLNETGCLTLVRDCL
ncbi:alpha-2,8-sialyltransferase 8B-like isoform X2 [Branchiostoma floridae]|uniref:Alpha-2,8-sialyltransferase 8B-like isoform X2 n=1 Tax=Branchiostoma floridae TaxID=7739 RepID=A0A9J7KUP4_BRAFL|nr:alpha-2,8-sialyltransferase 8B-like isoform X2 [Branchiostoma floridae]